MNKEEKKKELERVQLLVDNMDLTKSIVAYDKITIEKIGPYFRAVFNFWKKNDKSPFKMEMTLGRPGYKTSQELVDRLYEFFEAVKPS